jgi:predicted kinase
MSKGEVNLSEWLPESGEKPDWDRLDREFSWVRDLKDVPQDPVYHAEGDVWIHTRMVMEALTELDGYQALGAGDRETLFFATLMHDIAKPQCTTIGPDGRIGSPGHSAKGRNLARHFLYRSQPGPIGFARREHIVNLVRYHGLPLWFLEKPDSQLAVIKAAEQVNMHLLALLAEADVRGRICADQQELLDRIEFFRLYCQEQGVMEGAYPFESGLARWSYFRNPENGTLYVPYDDFRGEVVMMSGLPGSGKDHWIQVHGGGWPVISLDEIRKELKITPKDNQGLVINTARDQAREYLRKGQSFIWNATNIVPDIRKKLIDLFSEYKAKVKIVYLEVPEQTLFTQNADREDVVPRNVMERMIRKWEVPEVWEAPQVEYHVRED